MALQQNSDREPNIELFIKVSLNKLLREKFVVTAKPPMVNNNNNNVLVLNFKTF